MDAKLRFLPLGKSGFPSLRAGGEVYVDKTEMIHRLAEQDGRFFLARPRRFGKSLLVSTFWSLFKFGLRDFQGLKIAPLWHDKLYRVVRLDFSEVRRYGGVVEFEQSFSEVVEAGFREIGFLRSGERDIFRQLSDWLRAQPPRSIVVLIDEYDAPLTACLDDTERFKVAQSTMSAFYATLKSNDDCLRFLFVTGITKYSSTSIFSEFNNLTDISLDVAYGTLLGYTESEIKACFPSYLSHAAAELGLTHEELITKLKENYDGFCFDQRAKTHVFCPWSVLKFFNEPSEGFQNYWYESGGQPSVLKKYLGTHALADPSCYAQPQTVPLSALRASSSVEDLDPLVLLTQAGYLTIRTVDADGWVVLGYPNREVAVSMAALYASELMRGKRLIKPGAPSAAQVLARGSFEEVVAFFNWFFNEIDYQDYPVASESHCRALLQILLVSARIDVVVEKHTALGRSDLEAEVGDRHWVFELKFCDDDASAGNRLTEAMRQLRERRYGQTLHGKRLLRAALVFSGRSRAFVAQALLPEDLPRL